jgi:translation elongation factor EF-Tu-like GTPase
MDGAILVCSAAEGITEEASEHLRLAYRAGVRYVVVFLSNVDGKDDQSDIGTPSIVKLVDVPLVSGFRLQYYLRTTDETGVTTLPENMRQVSPGEHVEVDVELIRWLSMKACVSSCVRMAEPSVSV